MQMDITRSGLYTDFYELTMAQAYFCSGKHTARATFDLSFRTAPFGGGYAVFAGLEPAVRSILDFSFSADELAYLSGLGFRADFLDLLEGFRFSGDVEAFREGDIVFPGDVLMRISAPLIEAQLLESMLLNIVNFQTLIATKAMRIVFAARGRPVMDFGLRRAQAEASMAATRAAYIGGTAGTSNTLAAQQYDMPAIGTHAHSWIQSFDDELTAFSTYARLYPNATTLLVDTYNTLASGVPNAIRVARKMEARGERLRAIRLDSGDMAQLSKRARAMLDEAGLGYVTIVASNQLDEYSIENLLEQQAPIDIFGVGTRMICAGDQPALDGVYKLCEVDGEPKIKLSETAEKINSPGRKKVLRYVDGQGKFMFDTLALEQEVEEAITCVQHPDTAVQKTLLQKPEVSLDPVFFPVVRTGKLVADFPPLQTIQAFARERFELLPDGYKCFTAPQTYSVGLSEQLYQLRRELIERSRHE
jgi:nicotinate phosphoribosyltransferase